MSATAFRLTGWSLLLAGVGARLVQPHPPPPPRGTPAAPRFARAGDRAMVDRLTSATKFGPRVRRRLAGRPAYRVGGVAEAF